MSQTILREVRDGKNVIVIKDAEGNETVLTVEEMLEKFRQNKANAKNLQTLHESFMKAVEKTKDDK